MNHQTQTCGRPFPHPCSECGEVEVWPATIAYDAEIKHDGRLHKIHIAQLQVNQCGACGEVFFVAFTDDQISGALREHLNLLMPQQIRDGIKALGLSQKEFGERTGIAAETISRWIGGAYIQSRAMDTLMRLFFERGEANRKMPAVAKVTMQAGELTPWQSPTYYQIGDIYIPEPSLLGASASLVLDTGTGIPLEVARGPPAREGLLNRCAVYFDGNSLSCEVEKSWHE
jgi:putative zinc finger/helix-turn-helix YgiT family protein